MRGIQHRCAALLEAGEEMHEFMAQMRVKIAAWLVGEHDVRRGDDGARDGGALFLAAGKRVGPRAKAGFQARPGEQFPYLGLDQAGRFAADLERQVSFTPILSSVVPEAQACFF